MFCILFGKALPLCNQNDLTFQAIHQLDDNTVVQFVKTKRVYFYLKMRHRVKIFLSQVFGRSHLYN